MATTMSRVSAGTQNPCAANAANMSIYDMFSEYNSLKFYCENLQNLLSSDKHEVKVRIGGSYALKYWYSEFANREVHDYDFIVFGDFDYIKNKLDTMCKLGLIYHVRENYVYSTAYTFGEVMGKRAEVLLCNNYASASIGIVNSAKNVCAAKLQYIKNALQRHRIPRAKDVRDCYILLKHLCLYWLPQPITTQMELREFLDYATMANALNEPFEIAWKIMPYIFKQG